MRSSIEKNPSSVDIVASSTGKENGDSLEIIRLAPSPCGYPADYLRVGFLVVYESLRQSRVNPPR